MRSRLFRRRKGYDLLSNMKEKRLKRHCRPRPQPGAGDPEFVCKHCGQVVPVAAPGMAHRNHCPRCLWSVHLDDQSGDRAARCGGMMEPVAISVRQGGEWLLIHRCRECGALRANRIAGDDNELVLMSLAVRPLAQPPFPLERLTPETNHGKGDEGKTQMKEKRL